MRKPTATDKAKASAQSDLSLLNPWTKGEKKIMTKELTISLWWSRWKKLNKIWNSCSQSLVSNNRKSLSLELTPSLCNQSNKYTSRKWCRWPRGSAESQASLKSSSSGVPWNKKIGQSLKWSKLMRFPANSENTACSPTLLLRCHYLCHWADRSSSQCKTCSLAWIILKNSSVCINHSILTRVVHSSRQVLQTCQTRLPD